jgi:hypothetical protein
VCRRTVKYLVKSHGSTVERLGILAVLGHLGAAGTSGGAVKCVDIAWNADGESRLLGVCRR